ncbi:MAG TPA: ABC transporter substrate-binding protein [Acidimicrobiia bacterium]|jgi:ABC-type branched-subunit amino acid transport system substrate-binding protein
MRGRSVAVAAAVVVVAAACSSSSSGKGNKATTSTAGDTAASIKGGNFPAVDQPGVTPTEIRVSGVAEVTNPLGAAAASAFDGVQAYFAMVNAQGGIYGRKLVLAGRHDDNFTQNRQTVEAVIDQDNPFAVLPIATTLFTGASLLARANIPTFGWGIQTDWFGPPNFFPQTFNCIGSQCPYPVLPYVAQKLGKKRLGILAYNVAQSASCLDSDRASFEKYPTAKIVYATSSLSFGATDMSADVKRMADEKVDLVATCMDNNGTLTLAREMRQQGLTAPIVLPNAYDHDFMSKNAGFFQHAVVTIQEAPIETKPRFKALQDFVTWMGKSGFRLTENAEVAWVNADTFVTGLRAAGPNFTREGVVNALNKLADYDAGGMIGPIDWTRQHTEQTYPRACIAYVRVENGKFVQAWGAPGKPFTCWNGPLGSMDVSNPYARQ